jgi:hypothetical protein
MDLAVSQVETQTKDIYARFTRMFINLYQSPNILWLAGITWRGVDSSDNLGVCPSWIPYLGTVDDFGLFSKVSTPLWNLDKWRLSPVAPCSRVSAPRILKNLPLDPTWSSTIAIDLETYVRTATACRKFLRPWIYRTSPQLAEVRDEIWVLLGCDVPCSYASVTTIILVGEYFVYGIMEGEQTKDLLASGLPKNITLH